MTPKPALGTEGWRRRTGIEPARGAPEAPAGEMASGMASTPSEAEGRAEADGNRTRQARLGASPVLKTGRDTSPLSPPSETRINNEGSGVRSN